MPTLEEVMIVLEKYRLLRQQVLDLIGRPKSNRDPMAELSEWLVAALLSGTRAESRVQAAWDVVDECGQRIQVKYLANPPDKWVNEHHIQLRDGMDRYAIVFFEGLEPKRIVILPKPLDEVCKALGKRHRNQGSTLQLTQRNYQQMCRERDKFAELGVDVYDVPSTRAPIEF